MYTIAVDRYGNLSLTLLWLIREVDDFWGVAEVFNWPINWLE